jgi:hypothetical protein
MPAAMRGAPVIKTSEAPLTRPVTSTEAQGQHVVPRAVTVQMQRPLDLHTARERRRQTKRETTQCRQATSSPHDSSCMRSLGA